MTTALRCSQKFELFRTILIKKRDGYAHDAEVIFRDERNFRDFNGVVIVVLRVTLGMQVVFFRQRQRFVGFAQVEVGEPTNARSHDVAVLRIKSSGTYELCIGFGGVFVICFKHHGAVEPVPAPEFIIFDERENFLVRQRVLVPDDDKLFPVRHQLRDVLAEQRKRRIGNDNVGFL